MRRLGPCPRVPQRIAGASAAWAGMRGADHPARVELPRPFGGPASRRPRPAVASPRRHVQERGTRSPISTPVSTPGDQYPVKSRGRWPGRLVDPHLPRCPAGFVARGTLCRSRPAGSPRGRARYSGVRSVGARRTSGRRPGPRMLTPRPMSTPTPLGAPIADKTLF